MNLPLQVIFVLCIFLPAAQSVCRAQPAATNLWSLQTANFCGASSPALASDGTIYHATFDGRLLAITPQGRIKWTFSAGREIKSSPAVADDGTIYFGSRDGKFYAVTLDGNKKWTFAAEAWIDSSPAIAADGTVCFGSWDGNFYALNPDGSLKWKFAGGGIIDSSPAIAADGTIYFGSHDKNFYALTPGGKLRWKFATQGEIISSPAINSDGAVYFTSTDGNLYALHPDGTEWWRLHTGGWTDSSPVLDAEGRVYLGVNESRAGVAADGGKIWKSGSPELVGGAPAVAANGLVYFAMAWGSVIAFDAQGQEAWSEEFCHGLVPTTSVNIGPDGAVYAGDGRIFCCVEPTNSSPPARIAWPMFRANPRHTGRVNVN
jgi:outer membrane protein assembly factor BamB